MKSRIVLGLVWIVFGLCSCQSYRSIEIETYNPATITFPAEIKTVMVVNNSAQQPDWVGHRLVRFGSADSIISASADSTAYDFCLALGTGIAESPLFYDVRICDDTIRRDSLFYNSQPFTSDEVQTLCRDYDVDALLSLDKLFFRTTTHHALPGDASMNEIQIEMQGEIRILWPGQEEVYAIPFADSLKWNWDHAVFTEDVVSVLTMPDVVYGMRYLSGYTGHQMRVNFVPFWSQDKRWYYTSLSSAWKRGSVYAAAGKWMEAMSVWEAVLAETTALKQQARLSSNIALCYEIAGDFEKALSYAEKAYQLFKAYAGEANEYTQLQELYVKVVQSRIAADGALSKQLRE